MTWRRLPQAQLQKRRTSIRFPHTSSVLLNPCLTYTRENTPGDQSEPIAGVTPFGVRRVGGRGSHRRSRTSAAEHGGSRSPRLFPGFSSNGRGFGAPNELPPPPLHQPRSTATVRPLDEWNGPRASQVVCGFSTSQASTRDGKKTPPDRTKPFRWGAHHTPIPTGSRG